MEQDSNSEIILQLPQDIHKLCRICLCVANEELLSHEIIIFDEYNNLTEIAEMIQLCSTIKINPVEGLPMSICEECFGKLHISYDFINQCKNSDMTLKKILNIALTESDQKQIQDPKPLPKNNKNVDQNLSFYIEPSPLNDSSYDQIDLSKFFEQRHDLVEKYIKNETKAQSDEVKNKNENLDLIKNRKNFVKKDIPNNEEEDFFIKLEVENFSDDLNFNCTNCEKEFNNEDNFNKHQIGCGLKEKVDQSAPNLSKQVVGKKRKKEDLIFNCDLCSKTFTNAPKLALHFYNHAKSFSQEKKGVIASENHVPTCHLCLETFENNENLEEHIKNHDSFICEICSKDCLSEVNLVLHLKKHGIQVAFCSVCCKRFESLSSLKVHKKLHLSEKIRSTFSCPICQEEFASIDLLQEHSLSHLNEFYKCEKCIKTFNNIISYKHHLQQHFEPKHLCSMCGKSYFSKVTLQCHLRSHTNEKPFICTFCNKGFSSRSTLSVHKRIHSEHKPYICSYCGYSCRQSGDLVMHIRTHTGDKPYMCNFPNCGRKFTTCSQKREHYRRHTGERNHKCLECGKAFLESKTLKVHMLTHSGDKPHECNTCGKKFRRIHHLAYHIKSHAVSNATCTVTNSCNKQVQNKRKKIEVIIP